MFRQLMDRCVVCLVLHVGLRCMHARKCHVCLLNWCRKFAVVILFGHIAVDCIPLSGSIRMFATVHSLEKNFVCLQKFFLLSTWWIHSFPPSLPTSRRRNFLVKLKELWHSSPPSSPHVLFGNWPVASLVHRFEHLHTICSSICMCSDLFWCILGWLQIVCLAFECFLLVEWTWICRVWDTNW